MAKNIDFMGAIFPDVPSVKLPQQGGGLVAFDDTTDATATADKILQGYTAYAGGEKLVGTASGGSAVIEPLSVTANGTYSAPSGVDGYSPVTVNVSGGGGDHDGEDGIVQKTISGVYENSRVTKIGDYAFYKCSSLTEANFPNVTTVGSYAFSGCTSLASISFPSADYLNACAFYSCQSITTVSFPNVSYIGASVFLACAKIVEASFPAATYIGASAFANCYSLTTAYFPNLKSFGMRAFAGCSNLAVASLPSATSIASGTFNGCHKLTTAYFPLAAIVGNDAFYRCSSLMSVYILSTSVARLSSTGAFASTPMSLSSYLGHFGSIYVPASLVSNYKTANNWSVYSDRITAYTE